MNLSKEKLTFDDNGDPTYTVQIKDFHHKMKNWSTGRYVHTQAFKVEDVFLFLKIYPYGHDEESNVHVSVFLMNKYKSLKQLYVDCTFQIGDKGFMEQNDGSRRSKSCNHETVFPVYKPDEDMKLSCKILKLTTDKFVWELYYESN